MKFVIANVIKQDFYDSCSLQGVLSKERLKSPKARIMLYFVHTLPLIVCKNNNQQNK